MTDIRTVATIGYVLKTLEPFLDQTVPDEEVDAVFEQLETEVPRILEMNEDELEDYLEELDASFS